MAEARGTGGIDRGKVRRLALRARVGQGEHRGKRRGRRCRPKIDGGKPHGLQVRHGRGARLVEGSARLKTQGHTGHRRDNDEKRKHTQDDRWAHHWPPPQTIVLVTSPAWVKNV